MVKTGKSLGQLFLLLAFSFHFSAFAEVSVRSQLSSEKVGLGDAFQLTVSVTTTEGERAQRPQLPSIAKVQLVDQSSSTQSQTQIVSRGHGIERMTTHTTSYSYQFVTQSLGTIKIPPLTVMVENQSHKTSAFQVQVVPADQAPAPKPQRQRRRGGIFDDDDPFKKMEEMFNKSLKNSFGGLGSIFGNRRGNDEQEELESTTIPGVENQPFFIVAEVDKTEAYKGERILARWYLYTEGNASIGNLDTLKYPTLKGFWKEDIQISTVLQFKPENVNGRRYKKALLTSYALFPISEGKSEIDSFVAKATVMQGFGFSQRKNSTQTSEMIPVFIKALPKEGQPPEFSGGVGSFRMRAEVEDKTVVQNQPFALKIRFDGEGNAKLIDLPKLNLPEGIEIYDTSNEAKYFKNGQSYKEFTVLLVPRKSGEVTLPELKTALFDPVQEAYVSVNTDPIPINILPGTKTEGLAEERLESQVPEVVEKTLPALLMDWDPNFKASQWPWWWSPLALFAVLLFLFIRTVLGMGWLTKPADLQEELQERFQKIKKRLSKKEYRQVGIDVTNSAYSILGEISGLGGANVELPKMMAKIPPSVRRETEVPLTKLMDYFGVLGFGPQRVLKEASVIDVAGKNVKDIEALLLKAIKLSQGSARDKKK